VQALLEKKTPPGVTISLRHGQPCSALSAASSALSKVKRDQNAVDSNEVSHLAVHLWRSSAQFKFKQDKTMLISSSRNSSWTSVALITLAAALLVTVQDASAARPKQLSKKEVVALIATAESPEEHSSVDPTFFFLPPVSLEGQNVAGAPLKAEPDSDLGGEWDADRRPRAEKVA
jgi:hypothetical protein